MRAAALAAACAALLALAGAAGARVAAAGPAAAQLVIQAADVPGATVVSQKHAKGSGPITDEYERQLRFASPYGASKLAGYYDAAFVVASEPVAAQYFRQIQQVYTSPTFRTELLKEFGVGTKSKAKIAISHLLLRRLTFADEAFEMSFTATQSGKTSDTSLLVFRRDRVLEVVGAVGTAALLRRADTAALATLVLHRVDAILAPASVLPPTIAGVAQQGQTLTLATGTWTNTPELAVQWQRCDAAGANCVDIDGATGPTYVVGTTDVGTTLRAQVTATNASGSVAAVSAVTAVVS